MKDFLAKHSLWVLILLIVFFIAVILWQNLRGGEQNFVNQTVKKNAHLYKDSAMSIAKIKLKVFYAVPKDKINNIYGNFYSMIDKSLKEAVNFHHSQFRRYSELKYDIYPEPLFMNEDSLFYNTTNTNHGNPEGLRNVIPEIEKRTADFLKYDKDEFLIIGIIYEGVGASGAQGAFLLSREFLSDDQYQSVAAALLYHEFGHSLGLPDQYDFVTGVPYSNDIMGGGREKPININYLDKDLLKEMGIIQ